MRRFNDEQLQQLQESLSPITEPYVEIIVDYELALRELQERLEFWVDEGPPLSEEDVDYWRSKYFRLKQEVEKQPK